MKPITIEESKQIQMEILKSIHAFCEENHLTYFLYFGTLLGAVRHHGFIPWDDDIDILMPRKDYEILRKTYTDRSFRFVDAVTDDSYYLSVGKVIDTRTVLAENTVRRSELGVYVDVFVLDRLPVDDEKTGKALKRLLFLRKVIMLNMMPNSKKRKGIKRIAHAVLSRFSVLINMNSAARKMDSLAGSLVGEGEDSTSCGILLHVSEKGMKRRYESRLFEDRVLCEFEGCRMWIPGEYDALLTLIYGDYMQLPPEEKRVSHHEYEQYWKDR